MIRIIHPVHVITALALLLSGLLQPLTAAQAEPCVAGPGQVAYHGPASAAADVAERADPGSTALAHEPVPTQPQGAVTAMPCGTLAIVQERSVLPDSPTARALLARGDPLPTSAFLSSLFRPPRLG